MDIDPVPPTGERLALLRRLGFGELTHDSHVPFLSHLLGTRRLLVRWGERPALCDAGLFHSAYGTEYFEPDAPAERDEVRGLIGEEAEAIVWTWCAMRRDVVDLSDAARPSTVDRATGAPIPLTDGLLGDIATLWSADTVEQVERMAPEERGFAASLGRVLPHASLAAQAAMAPLVPLLDATP